MRAQKRRGGNHGRSFGFSFAHRYRDPDFVFRPNCEILQKAGYSGWWCLIVFVPLANVVMFYVFAFANWPVLRDKRAA
jgi:hypothetical protein